VRGRALAKGAARVPAGLLPHLPDHLRQGAGGAAPRADEVVAQAAADVVALAHHRTQLPNRHDQPDLAQTQV